MIPPHLYYQIYVFLFESDDCTRPKCGELSEYTDSTHTEVEDVSSRYMKGQICVTNAVTTQNNFILPAPPVRGLSISQDLHDRMKLNRNHTIPFILPNGNNMLADTMFKLSIGYTSPDTRQIQSRLGSIVCLFITPNANMAGYPTIGKIYKDIHSYTHPN